MMLTSWCFCLSSLSDWIPPRSTDTNVELQVDLSEDHVQEMLTHVTQLHSIR